MTEVFTLPAAEVKNTFSEVLNRARYRGEATIITVHGKLGAVVIPYKDYQEMMGEAEEKKSTPVKVKKMK